MEAGNFLVENSNIVTFVASNGRSRLDNIKDDATERPFQKLDPSSRLHCAVLYSCVSFHLS